MEWTKKSQRLWTAEANGRTFRIERLGSASANGGGVRLKEMDRLSRPVRQEDITSIAKAKLTAEGWLAEPPPTEVIRTNTRTLMDPAATSFQLHR